MTSRPKIELAVLTLSLALAGTSICSCASNAKIISNGPANQGSKPLKLALAEHLPPMSAPTRDKPLLVVYPRGGEIPCEKSFIVGSTVPGYLVTVNGAPVAVNKEGFFAHVVSLTLGKNTFQVSATSPNNETFSQSVTAMREKPPAAMSENTLAFDKNSFKPRDEIARTMGDIIELSVRATPGAKVSAQIGNRTIPMLCPYAVKQSATKGTVQAKLAGGAYGINQGLSVAYGQAFQHYPARRQDIYVGVYKIQPDDNFVDASITYKVQKDLGQGMQETTMVSAARLTTLKQPLVAHTLNDDTIVRTAPDAGRLTPLPAGVRLFVDGYDGENIRCLYKTGKHVWIKKAELTMEEGAAPAPSAVAKTIIVKRDNGGEKVIIPLSQRLPFTIDQGLNPNRLTLKIYGVTGDTDWMYQRPAEDSQPNMVDNITWKQPDDGTYEVNVAIKGSAQWGFAAGYGDGENENALVLKVRNSPVTADYESDLRGLTVCLDPGHGGAELGAIGPSGVREAQLNLAIALKARDALREAGATVYMTREDDSDVSLNDRVAFARQKGVAMLISIHNNALPDGRDPINEHGTSTYYYHPQSQRLAQELEKALAKGCNLKPIGARFQNLALCRPSEMLAVLVEVGFMVNPDEYAQLLDEKFQEKAGKSIVDGVREYLNRPR